MMEKKSTDKKNLTQEPEFIQKRLRELGTLAEINKEVHSTMNIDRLLQILVEKAVIGVNFERGLIYLVEGDFLRCVAFLDRVKRERGSTIKGWVGFRMAETAVEVLAVKTGKPIYVRDAGTDKRVSQKFLRITDSREYCVVPLMGRDRVLGVLTGDKFYSEDRILPTDIETLELFSGHIGLALDNARLYEEKERFSQLLEKRVAERTAELAGANERLSHKMSELSTLFEMSRLLSKSLRLEEVVDHILSMLKGLGYETCALHLWEEGRSSRVFHEGLDDVYTSLNELPVPDNRPEEGRHIPADMTDPVALSDLISSMKPSPLRDYVMEKGYRSGLLVPLHSKDQLIAVLAIYSPRPGLFKEEQTAFFTTFGRQAGVALEKALLFQEILDQRDHMESLSRKLEQENISLREKIKGDLSRKFILGKSPAMNRVMELIGKVSSTDATVMIYGETGTGKELVADAIHEMGPRKGGPLIKVNCAAIPEDLLESELFGHERGAFTGARERRIGMFQLAQGGTIFLDEIGDVSLKTQMKLLRVLQEHEIQPLGAKSPITVDVRVIAATNQDLTAKIETGVFRSDLYYRLNVFPLSLPPLRERREDIPELASFFLKKYTHLRPRIIGIEPDVEEALLNYQWPGNIRELENIIERLMIISRHDLISKNDLPPELLQKPKKEYSDIPLKEAMLAVKKKMVIQALSRAGGKKSKAAESLGMPRSNFSRLLKDLGMR
jgi:formate hydrogenlyase transcriptional activator